MSADPSIEQLETYIYNVKFPPHCIQTTLTSSSRSVVSWIRQMEAFHRHRRSSLIVSLNVDRRHKFNPGGEFGRNQRLVSALQLCVGHVCLIFQFESTTPIPLQLFQFLANPNYTFVGIEIREVTQSLRRCYDLHVRNTIDLRNLASSRLSQPKHMNSDLAALAKAMLGIEYWKPKDSNNWDQKDSNNWDQAFLIEGQKVIMYATIEAFLSFEIGIYLRAFDFRL